jgi:hypothetical protein
VRPPDRASFFWEKGGAVAKRIVMEEFHLTVLAPRGLPAAEYNAMRQALDDPRFHAQLRRAMRGVVRRCPSVSKVKVRVSR